MKKVPQKFEPTLVMYKILHITMMYYVLRNMKIFLKCDKTLQITNPTFTFDGETDPFEYVSTIYCKLFEVEKFRGCRTQL